MCLAPLVPVPALAQARCHANWHGMTCSSGHSAMPGPQLGHSDTARHEGAAVPGQPVWTYITPTRRRRCWVRCHGGAGFLDLCQRVFVAIAVGAAFMLLSRAHLPPICLRCWIPRKGVVHAPAGASQSSATTSTCGTLARVTQGRQRVAPRQRRRAQLHMEKDLLFPPL